MASLSHSEINSKDDKEWLELGLGFNNAPKNQEEDQPINPNIALPLPVSASSSSHVPPKLNQLSCTSTTGLELDLCLAIDSESKALLGHEDTHYDGGGDDDDDDDNDEMAWWWPCHTNSSSASLNHDWQMPVPNNSHHFFTRLTRPHSGLWFTLHSYTNRNGEALPQIPKAYIRVKDENVTIFMVKKYLVRKLGLSNEAEVEISCMGQRLLHTQTLKQVRDCVWFPSFHNYSLQSNSVNNHLMSLHYGRQCAFN